VAQYESTGDEVEASEMNSGDVNKRELARYFQEHKDDEDEWEEKAEEATVGRAQSIVYSVRFGKDELEELRRAAAARGVTLSELLRTSALEHVRESHQPNIEVAAPSARKVLFFSRTPGPRIGTRGDATTMPSDTAAAAH